MFICIAYIILSSSEACVTYVMFTFDSIEFLIWNNTESKHILVEYFEYN